MNQMTTCGLFILAKDGKPEKIITNFVQQAAIPNREEEIFRSKVYNTTFFF